MQSSTPVNRLFADAGPHPMATGETSSSTAETPPIVSRANSFEPLPIPAGPTRTGLERFVDSFFHEANIKWMLLVGAAIVFGSSLMLVTRHWTAWPGTYKFLTILGYSSSIYFIAEFCQARLGLIKTAKVMQGLTVLLIPTWFLALSWLARENPTFIGVGGLQFIGLMLPAMAMTWYATSRIFNRWLRGRQTVFLASYMLLAIAGAIPSVSNAWLATLFSFSLWGVMTVGVAKVNRHVFWLTEEHRYPRIFGFMPIGILTLQFVILCATKIVGAMPVEWLGLQIVFTGATVLLTARTVANVFRQRTGDLVRPLPWNLVAPLFVGLAIVVLGVILSFHGFSYVGPTTVAVVPTTVIAAVLMALAAKDTRHSAFVWAALVLTTIAYQCTPTLVADLVQQIKSAASQAINESRLPVAFYGVTYLPLILAYALGSRFFQTRARIEFSRPMKHAATVLTVVLFLVAIVHLNLKALFLVSVLNVVLFMVLAIMLRDRRYSLGTLAALLLVATSCVPYLNVAYALRIEQGHILTSLCVLAIGLAASRWPDRLIGLIALPRRQLSRLFIHSNTIQRDLFYDAGHVLLVTVSACWSALVFSHLQSGWAAMEAWQGGLLIGAWTVQTIRTRHYLAGLSTWVLVGVAGVSWVVHADMPATQLIHIATLSAAAITVAIGGAIRGLHVRTDGQFSWRRVRHGLGIDLGTLRVESASAKSATTRAFEALVVPLRDLAFLFMVVCLTTVHVPHLVWANVNLVPMAMPVSTTVAVMWALAMAWFFNSRACAVATTMLLPFLCTALVSCVQPDEMTYTLQIVLWSIVVGAESLVLRMIRNPVAEQCREICGFWAMMLLAISCVSFEPVFRLVAFLAMGSLVISQQIVKFPRRLTACSIMANAQVLLLAAYLGGMSGWVVTTMAQLGNLATAACWLMPTLGLSVLMFARRWNRLEMELAAIWAGLLRCSAVVMSIAIFTIQGAGVGEILLVVVGLSLFVVAEFAEAVRYQSPVRVWTSLIALGLCFAWLAAQHVIRLGAGPSQLVLVGITIACYVLAKKISGHARFGFAADVFGQVGNVGPALITALSVMREFSGGVAYGQSLNSLALFAAAGLYFYRGMTDGGKYHVVASGAILNIALALLWISMGWRDAQFYMVPLGLSILGLVEILQKELPGSSHNPLRYVGALTILVSPLFCILDGSWLHLFTLMVLCVLVIMLSIGLRLRVLVNTGSAFLLADLLGMVVRSSIDNPSLLWISGLGLGVAVIAVAAFCENHREKLLAKIRLLSAELASWR